MRVRDTLETPIHSNPAVEGREKRVRRRLMVGITAPRKGQVSGYTNNLAVHGFSVGGIHRIFEVGTQVRVILQLPDQERASIEGEVAWVRRGMNGSTSNMGIRFLSDSPSYRGFLKRFHPEVFR